MNFPDDEPPAFWIFVRPWAIPIFVAVLAGLQLASFANAFGIPTERVTCIAYVAGYLVDAYAVYALWRRSKTQSPVDRQRTRWITAGCMLGLTSFIFADSNVATTLWITETLESDVLGLRSVGRGLAASRRPIRKP